MRAVQIEQYGDPLGVREIRTPTAGPGEVLIEVKAAGVCATDVKLAAGVTSPPPPLPHTPGHEVAGVVVEGEDGVATGTRVAVHILDSCEDCAECRRGFPVLCSSMSRVGLDRAGGMAEYLAVPASLALPIADHVPFDQAAVAMDSVVSPWHALCVTGAVQPGETVLIVGVGGLGANAVQIARSLSPRVAALDLDPRRLERARSLGAELAVAPAEAEQVREWSGGGVDVAVDMSGSPAGFAAAADLVRAAGRVVAVGYTPGVQYSFDSTRFVLDNIQILGSRNVTRQAARAALEAIASGTVVPDIADHLRLEDVNEALARLSAGDAGGRIVLTP